MWSLKQDKYVYGCHNRFVYITGDSVKHLSVVIAWSLYSHYTNNHQKLIMHLFLQDPAISKFKREQMDVHSKRTKDWT
jgi:hypothetical protein